MKIKISATGLICLLFICCYIPPQAREIQTTFQIEKPIDTVWEAVIETFAERQFPVQFLEKDSGLIATDWILFTGQTDEGYSDCGGVTSLLGETTENREGKFNVFVKRISDNSCTVSINCSFRYKNKVCVSTGKLEAEMFKMINAKAE